jgi:hypothetical protein
MGVLPAQRVGFELQGASMESTVTTAVGVVPMKSSMRRGSCFRFPGAKMHVSGDNQVTYTPG